MMSNYTRVLMTAVLMCASIGVRAQNPTPTADVAKALDMDGELFFMWNLQQVVKDSRQVLSDLREAVPLIVDNPDLGIPEFWRNMAWGISSELITLEKQSGVAELTGAGYSVKRLKSGEYRHKLVMRRVKATPEGKVWQALKAPSTTTELRQFFPKNAVVAAVHPCRVDLLWQWQHATLSASNTKELAEWHSKAMTTLREMGVDKALRSMNGNVGFVVTASPDRAFRLGTTSIPQPGIALIAQVSDDSMITLAKSVLPKLGASFSEPKIGEVQTVSAALPGKASMVTKPTFLVHKGHLILASSPAVAKDLIAAADDPRKRLIDTPEVKRKLAGLPKGDALLYVSPKLASFWKGIMENKMASLEPGFKRAVQDLTAMLPKDPYVIATGQIGKDGLAYVAHTNVAPVKDMMTEVVRLIIALSGPQKRVGVK